MYVIDVGLFPLSDKLSYRGKFNIIHVYDFSLHLLFHILLRLQYLKHVSISSLRC